MAQSVEGGASRQAGSVRRNGTPPDVYALYLMGFVVELGLGIVAPILPEIMRDFSLAAWQIGLMVTVYGLARLVSDVMLGILLEKIDRTRLIVLGSLLIMVGSLGSGIAPDFSFLLIARFGMGMGAALCIVSALFRVSQAGGSESRAQVISLYQAALLAGTAFGPAFGGTVASLATWRAAFFFCALMGLVTLLVGIAAHSRGEPEASPVLPSRERAGGISPGPGEARRIPWDLVSINFTTFVFYLSLSAFRTSIVPLYGGVQLGIGTGVLGLMLGGTALVRFLVTVGSGFAADRYGRKVILIPGTLLLATGTLGFLLARDELGFALSLTVLAMGGFGNSLPTTMVVDVVGSGRVGLAISVNRFVGDTSMMVAPVMLGWIMDTMGFPTAAVFTAAILLSTIPGIVFTVREKQRGT